LRTVEVLGPTNSLIKKSTIYEVELGIGESIPFDKHSDEKIYYFLSGRGLINIYNEGEFGDVYEIRPDTAVWITPNLGHSVENKGHLSLRFLVIDAIENDREQTGRLGHKVTRVFDEGSNPSRKEGLHLRIRPIQIGSSQRFIGVEVNTIAPGKTTRPHSHSNTEENNYVLVGDGIFHINDEEIVCGPGSAQSYPLDSVRRLENKGKHPLNYINYVTYP